MRRLILILQMLLVFALTLSCQRDHLYYAATSTATVHLNVSWDKADISPNGLTVYAYRSDGSLYRRFDPVSTPASAYISLPVGTYDLVVMNDTPEEFSNTISFEGESSLDSFKARGVVDKERTARLQSALALKGTDAQSTPSQDYCIVAPDTLAVAVLRNVKVTDGMLDYFYDKPENYINADKALELEVEPQIVISDVHIKVHVKGLKYAKGTTLSYLRGFASGHCIGKEQTCPDGASQAFILNNRKFDDGSGSDGVISASFTTFGLRAGADDARYYLDINFVLVNGQTYPLSFDVTDMIEVESILNVQLKLRLKLDLEITLPEVIGGGGEDGSGFHTDVNDWTDIIRDIQM